LRLKISSGTCFSRTIALFAQISKIHQPLDINAPVTKLITEIWNAISIHINPLGYESRSLLSCNNFSNCSRLKSELTESASASPPVTIAAAADVPPTKFIVSPVTGIDMRAESKSLPGIAAGFAFRIPSKARLSSFQEFLAPLVVHVGVASFAAAQFSDTVF
jgi:hypothetical protein